MHVCLFDIDGTLLNSGGAGQAAMEAAFSDVFGTTRPAAGLSTAGRTDRAITLDLFNFHGVPVDDAAWGRFQAAYLRQLPEHLAQRDGLVLPGVVSLLDLLSRRDDVALGLLTGNFREGARLKLGHFQLHHHFTFGGYGDRHLDRDDVAREALDEVRRRFRELSGPRDIWVIGDTPADIRCGRAIGARVVAVATGLYSGHTLRNAGPDHFFDDFADPQPLLALLG